MATTRTAVAHWEGTLFEGAGQVTLESSGLGTYDVTWASRTEDPNGRTSPEELIAAAHSTCFSMSVSLALTQAGTPPQTVDTTADVVFQPGKGITGINDTNYARFDDPAIDAEISHLGREQLGPKQEGEYAALDRKVMAEAPWAPFGNLTLATFVSNEIDLDRVVYNPIYGHDLTSFEFR